MWPLYIGDLYGIGKKSAEKLVKIGICKIEDLALSTKEKLYPYFKNQSSYMINIANGIDDSEVISEISNPKCISETYTLLYDDINEINKELKRITESITNDLKKTKRYTSVIAVIIKDKYFKTNTHQLKLKNATDNKDEIYEVVKKLFKESWDETPIRLIGVRLDSLSNSNDYQISLFENIEEKVKDEKINKTIGELKKKFGDNIIK